MSEPLIPPLNTWIDTSAGDGEEAYIPITPGTGKALLTEIAQRIHEQDDQQQ